MSLSLHTISIILGTESSFRQRIEQQKQEYEAYINDLTPAFESLPPETRQSIESEIEKRLTAALQSAPLKWSETFIEGLKDLWKTEIVQEDVRKKYPYERWVEDR